MTWSDSSAPCCAPDSASNCWRECCNGNRKRCCDCCVPQQYANGGASCQSCANPKYRCICRSTIGTC
jgi:hypothetical protein